MTALLVSLLLSAEPKPGDTVTVKLEWGPVTVEQTARLVPCVRNKQCAQLPNGKRVQGRVEAGRFVVEAQP